jgi:hypothetical protein
VTADCKKSQLRFSIDHSVEGGASHFGEVLNFRSVTNVPCALRGYPGVDGLANNRAVVHAKRTPKGYLGGPGRTSTIVLLPGHTASALLEGVNGAIQGRPCPKYTSLLVTSPNEAHSFSAGERYPLCYLEVHPVVSDSGGGKRVG